jgi:hypothetical protein
MNPIMQGEVLILERQRVKRFGGLPEEIRQWLALARAWGGRFVTAIPHLQIWT